MQAAVAKVIEPLFDTNFYHDVVSGLSRPQKVLQAKYFYDTRGSHYFDEICRLPEYYPYREEMSLLPAVASELNGLIPPQKSVVEFGAGSLKKIAHLLKALDSLELFIPIDIAEEFLRDQCRQLLSKFPTIDVVPIAGDFTQPLSIPESCHQKNTTLGFFPGSTIGNFTPELAEVFLANAGRTLGAGSYLLIGVDTKKSTEILHNAYNDAQQVTAKFNLNLLARINKELGANFNLEAFEHYAFYNTAVGRIEMHLVSQESQCVNIADQQFDFDRGESIHTESSYKYNPSEFITLAGNAAWRSVKFWLTPSESFAMYLLQFDN